jgi:hypothetical protein
LKFASRWTPRLTMEDWAPLRPFLSVVLIISTLFSIVFLQMEERRMGYAILKLTRDQKELMELKRGKEMNLAQLTRPQHVESLAQKKFTLKKISDKQIIHLTGSSLVVNAERKP